MALLPYVLLFSFFLLIEYIATLISSFQLRSFLTKWSESRIYVISRPPHPLKAFLRIQKSLLFLSCFLTISLSFYLQAYFKFYPQYVLLAIVGFKVLDFLKKRKMIQLQSNQEFDMADAYQDDFDAFVTSWRPNLFIQIITLIVGAITLVFEHALL